MNSYQTINRQGLKLFRRITKTLASGTENVLFSPYSLFCCLAMAASGAKCQTREEILKLLDLDLADENFEENIKSLQSELSERMGDSLHQFRAAYLNDSLKAKSTYQDVLAGFYQAVLHLIDFSHPVAAADEINQKIEEHTCGMLKNVLSPEQISDTCCLILLDILFFQGIWDSPFDLECTEDEPFYAGTAVFTVPMMYQENWFPYFHDKKHKMHGVVLPYEGNDCELVAIMPTADKIPLQNVIDCLAEGCLDQWLKEASMKQRTEVWLPRMNLKSNTEDLVPVLKDSGVVSAFTEQADFSGILEGTPVMINQVMQSVKIEVDECGTKAAAATMMFGVVGCPPPKEVKKNFFRADRPFIALIYNKKVNTILFACAIQNPCSNEDEER